MLFQNPLVTPGKARRPSTSRLLSSTGSKVQHRHEPCQQHRTRSSTAPRAIIQHSSSASPPRGAVRKPRRSNAAESISDDRRHGVCLDFLLAKDSCGVEPSQQPQSSTSVHATRKMRGRAIDLDTVALAGTWNWVQAEQPDPPLIKVIQCSQPGRASAIACRLKKYMKDTLPDVITILHSSKTRRTLERDIELDLIPALGSMIWGDDITKDLNVNFKGVDDNDKRVQFRNHMLNPLSEARKAKMKNQIFIILDGLDYVDEGGATHFVDLFVRHCAELKELSGVKLLLVTDSLQDLKFDSNNSQEVFKQISDVVYLN